MAYYNQNALNILPDTDKIETLEAVLYTSKSVYNVFVSNPQGISISNSIDFNTISLPGSNGNKHVFNNRRSREINLPGIIFDTYSLGKGLQIVLNEIENLMNSDESGNYEYVGFRFGSTDFYPCYLVGFNYDVELFLGGNPAKLSAEISLVETNNLASVEVTENLESLEPVLSENEKVEASELALNELEANPGIIGDYSDYGRIVTGDSSITIDDTGGITLLDPLKGVEEIIGNFDPLNGVIQWL